MTKSGGIGMAGKIPWYISEELGIFRQKTLDKTLVMGRITVQSLPKLNRRNIICITNDKNRWINNSWANTVQFADNLQKISNWDNTLIAGGTHIYKMAFNIPNFVTKIHISIINEEYPCDSFFDTHWLDNFVITSKTDYDKFTHYELERTNYGEQQYLDVLKSVYVNGLEKVGRNGPVFSTFKNDMTFDLRNGFPLLTTKKMFYRGIVEEFIFFVCGRTDTTELSNKKVRVWEGNTSEEFIRNRGLKYSKGVMGPLYGWQWRFFNASYIVDETGKPIPNPDGGIDQLKNAVELIKTDPESRRILITTYNPSQAEQGVLYPCHSIILQFYVQDDYLDMFCYNRSQDIVLGVPFNIASSSLLLIVVSKLTNKIPRYLYMTLGDTHIYKNHMENVKFLFDRIPYKFPNVEITKLENIEDLEKLTLQDFILENYKHHSHIHFDMVA